MANGGLELFPRGPGGSLADISLAVRQKRESDDKTGKNERNHPVDKEVCTHLVRLIYHRRPTIGNGPQDESRIVRLSDTQSKEACNHEYYDHDADDVENVHCALLLK